MAGFVVVVRGRLVVSVASSRVVAQGNVAAFLARHEAVAIRQRRRIVGYMLQS